MLQSWNRNIILVWAQMPLSPYALGKRTLFWFGHERTSHGVLGKKEGAIALLRCVRMGRQYMPQISGAY